MKPPGRIIDDKRIAARLLDWYAVNARDFPFRKTRDPYKILVCEILLRKTTAKQVASIYHRFFERYPEVSSLARAHAKDVAKLTTALGIRSRARQLVDIARAAAHRFDRRIPSSLETLMKFKGVGRYVASCVLTFGYGARLPMVDSNAERILSRVYWADSRQRFDPWRYYDSLAPRGDERRFHYALMDLAHYVCRPKNPMCFVCPISKCCRYALKLFKY